MLQLLNVNVQVSDGGDITWVIILCSVLAVLAVAAAVFGFLYSKKVKDEKAERVRQEELKAEELAEEVVDEPVEEVASDEYVEEVVEEEPVEEIVEEPVYEEPIEEEPIEEVHIEQPIYIAEETVEESIEDEEEEESEEDESGDKHFVTDATGKVVEVSYKRSFESRLIQADKNLQAYYTEVKNELLSYKKVKSRISWQYDSFNKGRDQVAKLIIRGKTLMLYLALDPTKYEGTKYRFTNEGEKKKYAQVPMRIRVKSNLAVKYAKELIADMMNGLGVEQGKVPNDTYVQDSLTDDELIEKGLIKVCYSDEVEEGDTLVWATFGGNNNQEQ